MLSSKTKGLFVDISEYAILAARTSGYKLPMVVEAISEMSLIGDPSVDEIRGFIRDFIDFKGAQHIVSHCGVYPEDRFVLYHEVESVAKLKDSNFFEQTLESEFSVDPAASAVSILNAKNGSDYSLEKASSKKIIYCGASLEKIQVEQDRILEYGLFPRHLEISTLSTLGGVCDYCRFSGINAPVLCIEITSSKTNVFIQNRGQVDVARPVAFGLDSIYPLLQRELGLKDEKSARKLFFSNTFDFAEMGPILLHRVVKELQASTGFYEVQTGQTIENVFVSVLPKNLNWIAQTVADALGLQIIQPNLEDWMESLNVKIADDVEVMNLGARWLGLFSMMGAFHLREEAEA